MNIYVIDDDIQKLSFVQPILERLRERTPVGGPQFEDGFGGEGANVQFDSEALMRAVKDPEGICLIDMLFNDEAHQIVVDDLIKLIEAESASKDILKSYERMNESINHPGYSLALLLLAVCQQFETKCLTISTMGTIAIANLVKGWGFKGTSSYPDDPHANMTARIEEVVSAILAQIDFVEDLRKRTLHWFTDDAHSSEQLWHTWDPARLIQHQSLIQQTWPWFPERWWATDKSANNLHENLKHLCGSTAGWIGGNSQPRSLSVGAAYLLALMIMEQRFPGWAQQSPETLVQSFEGLKGATLRWLPEQDQKAAEEIFRAYVDVLLAVGVLKDANEPGIRKIIFEEPGRRMQLVLAWDEADVEKLAQKNRSLFTGKAELTVSLGPVSQTLANLHRLHALSQINNKGFGAPGYFYIEENSLHVGS